MLTWLRCEAHKLLQKKPDLPYASLFGPLFPHFAPIICTTACRCIFSISTGSNQQQYSQQLASKHCCFVFFSGGMHVVKDAGKCVEICLYNYVSDALRHTQCESDGGFLCFLAGRRTSSHIVALVSLLTAFGCHSFPQTDICLCQSSFFPF